MTEHGAWLDQSQSDLAASIRVLDRSDGTTYCHAIAKAQQAVEKSIKGLMTVLRHNEIVSVTVGWKHDVERFMTILVRLAGVRNRGEIGAMIANAFDQETRGDIRAIDRLVPKRPPPGSLPSRNTEYPYQAHGVWHAPSESDSFTWEEVRRFQALAHHVVGRCRQIASVVEKH